MTLSIEELKAALTVPQQKAAWLIHQNELSDNIEGSRRSYEDIANDVGVDVRTLYNWRKQDRNFIAYKNAIADVTLYSYRDEVDAMLMKLIRGGNNGIGSIKALQLYYQMIGKLVSKQEMTIVNEDERRTKRLTDEEVSEQLAKLNETIH
ncbi:phBC6A51 family helix-turn-helix protein [Heyndrickxia sporothermodurans]|uniref:phBC6A51 family helix-turn-helix protein n=2 Tax=Bacillati TaxID=1783272 RepID=UPI0035DA7543